jgi:hypothetical protein
MAIETPPIRVPTAASERAELRTVGQRRRRVLRRVLLVAVLALAMLVLTVVNREQQAIDSCRERMEYALKVFQERYDQGLPSPTELPLPSESGEVGRRLREHVLYNWFYTESARAEVGVCCCQHAHTPLFFPDGRHVIIFNVRQGRYELRWMEEDEFARRADDLGLRVRVQP